MEINFFFFIFPLACLSLLENMLNKKSVIIVFVVSFLFFLFFIGFGYKIGVDWLEYSILYKGQSENSFGYEIGYVFLNNILYYLGVPFWCFYFFVKIFFVTSVSVFFYKFSRRPTFCLFVFTGLMFPFFHDPLRQLIASSILLFTFSIFNRNIKLFAFLSASFMHYSFFVMFLTWFNRLEKRTIIYIAGFFVLTAAIFFAIIGTSEASFYLQSSIFLKIKYYINEAVYANYASTVIRICFLSYVCLSTSVANNNGLILGSKLEKTFWFFSVFYLSLEIAFLFLPIIPQRMRFYFLPFAIVLFSNELYSLRSIFLKWAVLFVFYGYVSFSIFYFMSKPIGVFYSLDKNLIMNIFSGEQDKDIGGSVYDFWENR